MNAIIQADRLAAFLDRLNTVVSEAKLHTEPGALQTRAVAKGRR